MKQLPIQLLINITIAALWMFLNDSWNIVTFFSGYLVGLAIIFAMRRFFPDSFYLRRVISIGKLMLLFLLELISSSLLVIRQILKPKLDIKPGVFTLNTELEGEWEVTILALLLSLTPGSAVLEVSQDGKSLTIHAMDIPVSSDSVKRTKVKFEKAIMEVTRDV